jgi:hypothetical protein
MNSCEFKTIKRFKVMKLSKNIKINSIHYGANNCYLGNHDGFIREHVYETLSKSLEETSYKDAIRILEEDWEFVAISYIGISTKTIGYRYKCKNGNIVTWERLETLM